MNNKDRVEVIEPPLAVKAEIERLRLKVIEALFGTDDAAEITAEQIREQIVIGLAALGTALEDLIACTDDPVGVAREMTGRLVRSVAARSGFPPEDGKGAR